MQLSQKPHQESDDSFIPIDMDKELRCPGCRKLLLKGDIEDGSKIEIKCPRCKQLCRFCKV